MAKIARTTMSSPATAMATLKKDWISNLPDEILILVLSRLGMKEAARTSVLSHRWKHVWKFYTGCFQFDVRKKKLPEEYVNWVNQVLDSHQSHTIEELRISFDLDKTYTGFIDRWFDFAISRGVRRLELDLSPSSTSKVLLTPPDSVPYSFPIWLMDWPLGFSDIKVLTSLRLRSVDLTEEVVHFFLSNCPMLEHLCVDYAPSLQNLRIAGNSLNLKHLEITNCSGLKKLHISAPAPNLVSFKYWGPRIDMLFKDIPILSSLSLGGPFGSPFFIEDEVETLPFSFSLLEEFVFHLPIIVREDTIKLIVRDPEFTVRIPDFTAVKRLELNFYAEYTEHSILCLSSFIHACPRLEKLVFNYEFFDARDSTWNAKDWERFFKVQKRRKQVISQHKHVCLKVMEFHGWIGLRADFELATYLIKTAPALQEIIITPGHLYCPAKNDKAAARDMAAARGRARRLEPKLSSSRTKLIIL